MLECSEKKMRVKESGLVSKGGRGGEDQESTRPQAVVPVRTLPMI